jgi:hypothetical protein
MLTLIFVISSISTDLKFIILLSFQSSNVTYLFCLIDVHYYILYILSSSTLALINLNKKDNIILNKKLAC